MAYDDPAWEEWDRKARSHYETTESGYTTRREEKMIVDKSTDVTTPSGNRIRQTPSGKRLSEIYEQVPNETEIPAKGRTIKSKIKSKLKKMRSEQPIVVEVVDEEMEAAHQKGYDAHMKDKRARDITKAEKKGRREAMTFKSKVVADATTVAEKLEPVGKRVAKNVGKLLGEAKYTAKAAARAPARAAVKPKTTTVKPKTTTVRKAKPGPAVRKGTIGRGEGWLPVKSKKDGPGRRVEALGVRSKHGPENKPKGGPGHKSNKPTPTNNIPKATLNRQHSINFAMKKRSRK